MREPVVQTWVCPKCAKVQELFVMATAAECANRHRAVSMRLSSGESLDHPPLKPKRTVSSPPKRISFIEQLMETAKGQRHE